MFVDPNNQNRYGRCWSEGRGLNEAGIAAETFQACEERAKSTGLRPVAEKPGGMSGKSFVVSGTIMRAPDGTEERCEATADRGLFELPGLGGNAYLARAVKAERDCIERLKRLGYKPVWLFEQADAR